MMHPWVKTTNVLLSSRTVDDESESTFVGVLKHVDDGAVKRWFVEQGHGYEECALGGIRRVECWVHIDKSGPRADRGAVAVGGVPCSGRDRCMIMQSNV